MANRSQKVARPLSVLPLFIACSILAQIIEVYIIYNNSFNIFILISIKMLKQKQRTKQEVQNLIKFAFFHINNLPKQKIEQAVILVSVHNGMQHVYKALINADISTEDAKQPQFQLIGEKRIPLIYPTEAFLNPQKEHNFVSMHYLLNSVRKVKFLFAFKHADLIQSPINNIKKTISNLISLFEKSIPNIGSKLSKSCGLIINEARLSDKMKYIQILDALHKQGNYISNVQVKNLARQSIVSKNIILFYADPTKNQKSILQMFSDLTNYLQYFELPPNIHPAILSAENQYIPNKISEIWSDYFKKLYHNLQLIITQAKTQYQNTATYRNKQKEKRMQDILAETPEIYVSRKIWEKQWPKKTIQSYRALRLCKFIQKYLTLIAQNRSLSTQNYKETEEVVTQFLSILFDLGYLQKYQIYFFVVSFFTIYQFLCSCENQMSQKLLEKINFKQIIMNPTIIDEKMSYLINYLYNILDQQIFNSDIGYPFVQIIQSINQILKKLQVAKYGFATERTLKKFKKYKAELAFKRANFVTNAYNITKSEIRNSWVQFLGYAYESTLIQSSKLEQALSFIAQQLTKSKSIKLALKVYSYLPEYKSYKKIIAIYERDLKFNPQIMKYTLSYDWPNKRDNFEDYCKFLLKIGFYQQVRGLCLQGLKVIEDDQEGIQLLKGLLISARGEQGRDIHNKFLQNLSEEQMKKINIDEKLLAQIQDEFKKKI